MLPTPRWLDQLPPETRPHARRRFLLRIAALYANEEGHMVALAKQLGLAPKTLGPFVCRSSRKKIPPRMAREIEAITAGIVASATLTV